MKDKKTDELKIRCTQQEKICIIERAKSAGKSLSEFTREMLLKGKVVAVPRFTELELEGIRYLKKYEHYFTLIGNYIKKRDGRLFAETRDLIELIKKVIEHFFSPKTDEK